jgi:hypothetical protein
VTTPVLAWLSRPDAASALRPASRSAAPLHTQVAALRQRLDQAAGMFAEGQTDASQLAAATKKLNNDLAAVNLKLAELGPHDGLAAFRGRDPAAVWAGLNLHPGKYPDRLASVTAPRAAGSCVSPPPDRAPRSRSRQLMMESVGPLRILTHHMYLVLCRLKY